MSKLRVPMVHNHDAQSGGLTMFVTKNTYDMSFVCFYGAPRKAIVMALKKNVSSFGEKHMFFRSTRPAEIE